MQVAKLVTCANYATWWSTLESLTGIFFWTEFAFFLAIFQVIESIPWVRCASGNIFVCAEDTENTLKYCKKMWSICNLQRVLVEQERTINDGSIFLLYPRGDILLTRTTNQLKISTENKKIFRFFATISDFLCVFWIVWHPSNAN